MATTPISPKFLPQHPSAEYLRKQAKRFARTNAMQLAAAQRRLAHDYGYRNWAALMIAVQTKEGGPRASDSGDSGLPLIRGAAENVFPLLPLRGLIAFPHVSYPIFLGRPKSIKAAVHAHQHALPVLLVAQRSPELNQPAASDMYEVGTIAAFVETLSLPDGTMKTVVEGQRRAKVQRFMFNEEFFKAEAEAIDEPVIQDSRLERVTRSALSALLRERLKTVAPGIANAEAFRASVSATTRDDARVLADRMASELRIDLASKQGLLEILNPVERLEKVLDYLNALA